MTSGDTLMHTGCQTGRMSNEWILVGNAVSLVSPRSSNTVSEFQGFIQSNKLSRQRLPWIQFRTHPLMVPMISLLSFQQQQTNDHLSSPDPVYYMLSYNVVVLAILPISKCKFFIELCDCGFYTSPALMAVFLLLVVKGTNELIKALRTPYCAQDRKTGCVQNHSLSAI